MVKVNNRKLLDGVLASAGVEDPVQKLIVMRAVDKLDKFSLDDVRLLLGEGRMDESGDFTKGARLSAAAIDKVMGYVGASATSRADFLNQLSNAFVGDSVGAEGLAELARVDAALNGLGVGDDRARFDPSVVRGLEYYTGPVFEAELLLDTRDEKGERVRFGSVGGGGRYDDLAARFTGQRVPATGFSFGVSRLVAAMRTLARMAERTDAAARGPVVVIAFDESAMADYFALAAELRAAGIAAEVYLGRSGMKAQMKYADRRLSPAAVMLGEDERKAGTVTIKDLDLGRELAKGLSDNQAWREARPGQQTVDRRDLVDTVRRILEG